MKNKCTQQIDYKTETRLTPKEAAKQLGIHVATAWRYILDGKLESIKIGGKRLTSVEAIDRMIARQNPDIAPTVSPRQRSTELAKLERELEKAGV